MSYITNKQDGFTLVEIAIVLVIIGVLLGGVLKGQELIKSAQVRNLIDQSSSIQAAYYGFVDRYHQIPGDMRGNAACKLIGNQVPGCPNGVGGDGNRIIEGNNWQEVSAVWAHLAVAGFIQGNYQGGATDEATYRDPAQAPANAFGGLLVLSRSNCYRSPTTQSPPKLNLVLGRNLPVDIIQQFDVKVDDGLPTTGTVRATGGDCGEIVQGDRACVTDGAPPIWNINGDSSDCNAAVLY